MTTSPESSTPAEAGSNVHRASRHRGGLVVAAVALALSSLVLGVSAAVGASSTPVLRGPVTEPRVLGVHPGLVHGRGGTRILVLGKGFTTGTTLTVGGKPARVLTVRNPGALFALAPRGIGTAVVRADTLGRSSARNARSMLRYVTRVLVVGDSLGIDLGWGFSPALAQRARLSVTDDAVGSSGLVRSDFYDWPAHLRADLAATRPDVVVTMFGTNDQQSFRTARGPVGPGSTSWDRLYAAHVRQIATIVHRAGATLVWVSLPRMGPASVLGTQFVAHLVALDHTVVASLRRATFVDAWRLFSTQAGAYTPYVEAAPHDWTIGHAPDGTHLTAAGATAVDVLALTSLERLLAPR